MLTPTLMFIIACLLSYFFGSLPFGLWVGLLWKGVDIRTLGSKNIGATNVLRVLGPGPGVTVFALDTLKGVAGVLLYHYCTPAFHLPEPAMKFQAVVGLCAILGHTFSIFLRFKGGKGVATTFGVLLGLAWVVALVGLGIWLALVAVTRYVSLASIVAACSLPITSYFTLTGEDRAWMVGLCILLAMLVTVKHRSNIQRLLSGTETKVGQHAPIPPAPFPPGKGG